MNSPSSPISSNLTLHPLQFSSAAQHCPPLCNPTGCSTPGLPAHHQHPETAQTHVPWVGDIIQQSHPPSSKALTRRTFVGKVTSLLFNMLSRLVIAFLPSSNYLLISWLQSPSEVILEPRKITVSIASPSICHEVMGLGAMILVFWMLSFKPTFSLSSFTFHQEAF